MNAETPAVGTAGASGKGVGFQRDTTEIAHRALEIQTSHLRRRFNLSPAVAAVVAGLAYGQADSWRVAR